MKKYLQTNRLYYYLGAALVLLIILFEARGEGDFNIFISASKDLLLGKNIYTIKYNEWYHYYYDVLFAVVLIPFTFLPLYFTKLIWLIFNLFFVYRIWKIITYLLPISELNKKYKNVFIAVSFIFILKFLRDNFHLAQMTIFILFLSLEGLFLIGKNKKIAGSCLIAIGIDIKLLPLVLLPYLLYRSEWKSAVYVVGFVIFFLFLPVIFIGYDYNNFLLAERWKLINPSNQEHIFDTSERSFHSLTTLLTTLFIKNCGDTYSLNLKRNIADVSIDQLNIIINSARAILVLFTIYFLKTMPFKSVSSKTHRLYELSYIFLIIPLIFPHQQHYAFFFIFPATTYILFYLFIVFFQESKYKSEKYYQLKKIGFIAVLGLIYLLTNSHFILGVFNNYYDHYKTLTYGVLILMAMLAFCNPKKLALQEYV